MTTGAIARAVDELGPQTSSVEPPFTMSFENVLPYIQWGGILAAPLLMLAGTVLILSRNYGEGSGFSGAFFGSLLILAGLCLGIVPSLLRYSV